MLAVIIFYYYGFVPWYLASHRRLFLPPLSPDIWGCVPVASGWLSLTASESAQNSTQVQKFLRGSSLLEVATQRSRPWKSKSWRDLAVLPQSILTKTPWKSPLKVLWCGAVTHSLVDSSLRNAESTWSQQVRLASFPSQPSAAETSNRQRPITQIAEATVSGSSLNRRSWFTTVTHYITSKLTHSVIYYVTRVATFSQVLV